jgi:predicted CopG family antitoxin
MKQIRVREDQRDELHDEKQPNESYADVLERVHGVGADE